MEIELPNRFLSYYSVRFPRSIRGLTVNVERSSLKTREIGKIVYIWESIITAILLGASKDSVINNINYIISRINLVFYDFFDESNIKSDIDFIYACLSDVFLNRGNTIYNMENLMDRISKRGNSIIFKTFVEL